MEKETIKKIAAGLEIYIYILVAFYLIQKYISKYWIEDLKDNFNANRQSPLTVFFSGFLGKDSKETFGGIVTQKVTELFKNFLGFLTPVFSAFGSIFSVFQDQINGIRNILKPMRDFFKQATNVFYDKIQGFTIGILYSLHKIRNTMRRSLSGFNLIFHTLEHNKNTIESLIESPPVALAEKLLGPLDWVYSKGRRLAGSKVCFDEKTVIKLKNKQSVSISNIAIGDILSNGSKVIATHKFLNREPLYSYGGVQVTGSHLVYTNGDTLVRVDSLGDARLTTHIPQFVYSLSTNNKKIVINDITFADYSESSDRTKNYEINHYILSYLNGGRMDIEAFPCLHLDHGFAYNTFIALPNNSIKRIEDIQIGDILASTKGYSEPNIVVGKIELLPEAFQFYNYSDIRVSSNMKVIENGIWKSVELSKIYDPCNRPKKCFNLVTSNGHFLALDKHNYTLEFKDYMEHRDDKLYDKIESIVTSK